MKLRSLGSSENFRNVLGSRCDTSIDGLGGVFNSDLELLSTTRLGCPDPGILRPDFVV
jgi:hypothetical protein